MMQTLTEEISPLKSIGLIYEQIIGLNVDRNICPLSFISVSAGVWDYVFLGQKNARLSPLGLHLKSIRAARHRGAVALRC